MKPFGFALILSLIASAVAADLTWFVPEKNSTCTGHEADGSITCEHGHIDNAPVFERDSAPAIRGREPDPLDKRVSCGLPILGGSSCFVHCFAIGYCNSYCDNGVCKCKCLDLGTIDVCRRTTCS